MTHWSAHERVSLTFFKGFTTFLYALTVCYNERREPEASGLFIQANSQQTIVTISNNINAIEVFDCIKARLFFYFYNSKFLIDSNKQILFYSLPKAIVLSFKLNIVYFPRASPRSPLTAPSRPIVGFYFPIYLKRRIFFFLANPLETVNKNVFIHSTT